jgi:hypothetical protein
MLTKPVSASSVPPLDWGGDSPLDPGGASAPGRREHPGAPPGAAPIRAVAARRPSDPLSLAGLTACVEDARKAALSRAAGPSDPADFASLRMRLDKACARLPPTYRTQVGEPLLRLLDRLGPRGFARVLAGDPEREGDARLMLDVSQALLQHGERYQARATDAFQEVVSDLYDGFLSAEDRRGVKPPDHGVTAPLVRWGSAEAGPYTWPATATASLGVKAAVVSLPAANASAGLLAWPALAHEAAGHDVLAADDGLRDELSRAVRDEILARKLSPEIAGYWSERIDESAADVLGVLNMGPSAAVGLVGYFRALNAAWRGTASLRNVGRAEDPHPADIARAYLAAETVRLLDFDGAGRWADRLVAEADRDLGQVRLGGSAVSAGIAKASAAAVARAVVTTRLRSLEGRALGEIQNWRNEDEAVVAALRRELSDGAAGGSAGSGPAARGGHVEGAYAAHAVAAGVYEAAAGGAAPAQVMERMIAVLGAMNRRNPAWETRRSSSSPASHGGERVA